VIIFQIYSLNYLNMDDVNMDQNGDLQDMEYYDEQIADDLGE
jgi:hypothetical protein